MRNKIDPERIEAIIQKLGGSGEILIKAISPVVVCLK
jgi:hypothetical protein